MLAGNAASLKTWGNDMKDRGASATNVADASKHHGIGRVPAVEGASPQIVGTPIGLTIVLTREVVRFFLALNDGSKHDVDQVLRTAVAYWRTDLSAKNLSSPF